MVNAEDKVSEFYNTIGWEEEGEVTEDAKRWEDLRENSKEYVSKCRLRVLRHIPEQGEYILDMASGPIQYKEYLEFSRNYNKRYCVDLSKTALENAKKKLGDHGVYLNGSFFDLELDEDYFDCAISLHTIYHIDKDRQEEAVRKLIKVTKHGKPVVIVYSNPNAFNYKKLINFFKTAPRRAFIKLTRPFYQLINKIRSKVGVRHEHRPSTEKQPVKAVKKESKSSVEPVLYFYPHPNTWWSRFEDVAKVEIYPWRSFEVTLQKRLIPDNKIGKLMLKVLFYLEDRFPELFSKHFTYPMIVLTKKK